MMIVLHDGLGSKQKEKQVSEKTTTSILCKYGNEPFATEKG